VLLRRIQAAIERGRVPKWETVVLVVVVWLVSIAAVTSLTYINPQLPTTFADSEWVTTTLSAASGGLLSVLLVGAILGARWLRPRVEIAPLGQTRLWRSAVKVAAPLLVIVGGALAKSVFGS
jgi:hypothetical protein